MSKRKGDKGDESSILRDTGGLADTNCGLVLRDIVKTRSWTIVIVVILLMGIFLRAAVGLGGYSGVSQFNLIASKQN